MKIGIITPVYPPTVSGTSTFTKTLEDALKNKGLDVYVATPKISETRYEEHILPLNSIKFPEFLIPTETSVPFLYRGDTLKFFKEKKVDVIHSMNTLSGARSAFKIAENLNIPSIHSYNFFWEGVDHLDFPGRIELFRSYSKMICNNHDHVIAPSAKIENYLKEIGVTKPITELLALSSNSNKLKPKPRNNELRKKHGINEKDFVIISFGRVSKEKNLDKAISSLTLLLQNNPSIKYVIAGKGTYQKELEKIIKRNKIENQVIFTGKFTHDDLPDLASLADLFLFSSRHETQGLVVFEAMLLGLPVVAVNDEATSYILKDGFNGFKCEEKDFGTVCEKLFKDKNLLKKTKENAYKSALELKEGDLVEKYIELYDGVIKNFR